MKRIFLTTDPQTAAIPEAEGSLCIYHASLAPPVAAGPSMEFTEFRRAPRKNLNGVKRLVIAGLNKIITPGNRTDEVFEVLFNNTPDLEKISVDRTLFDAAPWRLWFHFGATNSHYDGYTYSYLIESHYRAWLEGIRETNPVSTDAVLRNARRVVTCAYDQYFSGPVASLVSLDASVHADYQKLKARCFDECGSATQIIARLSAFAQAACGARNVPSQAKLFRSRDPHIVMTDLAVDRFLVGQIEQSIDLTNAIAAECHG